ncbi:hypothetical protein RP20_CCG002641 [Aedes albopictus]|nr:hypothetical protein RP20_CCG002641 [Aedes albopictus]
MDSIAHKYPFITKEYLESVLRESHKCSSIVVQDFTVVPALAKGQNYSSDILRVKICYVEEGSVPKNATFIIKASLDSEELADMIEEAIKVSTTKPNHIIFEDLTESGFVAADRKKGLIYHELVMVLERIAHFHAATAYMFSKDESTMQYHHYPNINPDQMHFHPLYRNCLLACAEEARKWPTISSNIAEKLFRLEKSMMPKAFEIYKSDKTGFNVLCHCDLSVNNVMLKFDSVGNSVDCRLVDFAIGFFGSPAMDLSYLLFTSSADDVTTDQFDELLQYYHTQFVDTLVKLGYGRPIPTLNDIQVEMLRKGFLGVMHVPLLLPLRLIEDTANADLSHLIGSSEAAIEFRRKMFSHPRFQSRMECLLSYFDRKGYLD